MAGSVLQQQGVPADLPKQQQQRQVAPDAQLVIDDSTLPKRLNIEDDSCRERRLQLIKTAERRMAPRFLLGIFLTIFINYIDRWGPSSSSNCCSSAALCLKLVSGRPYVLHIYD
jgi:hypothetical protein